MATEYESVIGLEVHAQIQTISKIFCACSTTFGAPPNTHTCPVCLGLPGALPLLNQKAVELAVRAALATHCEIRISSRFARKNYFYPDLPKGYQISQFALPFAEQGYVEIPMYQYETKGEQKSRVARTGWKQVNLIRIHMEEDAGKNVHTQDGHSLVDLNRAGVPLIEIVTAPDMSSAEEATEYLKALRHLLVSLNICNGNLEEGSFRCDANVSLRPKGTKKLGTRVEIKNLNSFRFVKQAIDYECKRQEKLLENNEPLKAQTRGFDSDKGVTYPMRDKEGADDYRYFPEPDLPPLVLKPDWLKKLGENFPELFREKVERFEQEFQLSWQDAETLSQDPERAMYFEKAIEEHENPKGVANWILNDLLGVLQGAPLSTCKVTPKNLGALITLIDQKTLSGKLAKNVFETMLTSGKSPEEIVKEEKLEIISDVTVLEKIAKKIIKDSPKELKDYQKGKKKVLGFFVGKLMKETKGKASPNVANEVFLSLLDKESEDDSMKTSSKKSSKKDSKK